MRIIDSLDMEGIGMSIFISSAILILFILGCYYLFNFILLYMKKVTTDFFIQILPGWFFILLISIVALYMYPDNLHGVQLLVIVFYISFVLCIVMAIAIVILRPFYPLAYHAFIQKVKTDRQIR